MESMDDELGRAPRPSDLNAQPGPQAAQPSGGAEAAASDTSLELVLYSAPRKKRGRLRIYTWLLLFLFAVTAVLGSQVRRTPTYVHASDSPPPIETPTWALLPAYELAREATVRIEARRRHWKGQGVSVGTGFCVSDDGMIVTAFPVVDASNAAIRAVQYVAVTADERVFRLGRMGFGRYLDLAAVRAKVDRKVP